jgi:hypothetical protein
MHNLLPSTAMRNSCCQNLLNYAARRHDLPQITQRVPQLTRSVQSNQQCTTTALQCATVQLPSCNAQLYDCRPAIRACTTVADVLQQMC